MQYPKEKNYCKFSLKGAFLLSERFVDCARIRYRRLSYLTESPLTNICVLEIKMKVIRLFWYVGERNLMFRKEVFSGFLMEIQFQYSQSA
jgi:hypothetical protein